MGDFETRLPELEECNKMIQAYSGYNTIKLE